MDVKFILILEIEAELTCNPSSFVTSDRITYNVAGTRGCTWFVRAPSNNCTISPTDKWISRGGARTVGACTAPREEQGPPHVLRHVRLPHGRCPNLWQPAASQLNPPSFHKTNQTPRCPQHIKYIDGQRFIAAYYQNF